MIYASKYYDPVKAHAYYESHKHLKGRHSTRGLEDYQKQMAAYTKSKLDKAESDEIRKASVKSQRRAAENRKRLSQACKARIDSLKSMLKNMPEAQKADARALIENRIRALKSEYGKRKKQVTQNYSSALGGELGKIRKDYSNKYTAALNMIKGK